MKATTLLRAALTAAVLLAASRLGAQQSLSLEQARSSALARSLSLRRALLSADSARLAEKLQGYELLPSLSVSAGVGAAYPSSVSTQTMTGSLGLSLSQTVFDRRQWVRAAIDRLSTQIAREEARGEYFAVLQSVDDAFYGLLEAQAAVEAAQSDLEAYRAHLSLAQAKLEAGIITRYTYLEAVSQAAARETALIQAQGRLSVAEGKLASLTGLDRPLHPEAVDFAGREELMGRVGALAEDGVAALVQAVFGSASANNPSLKRDALTGRKSAQELALARAGYLPSIGASYSHSFDFGTRQALDAGSGALRLSASLPLDLWKTRASVQAADLAAQQAGLEAEDARQSLLLDVQGAVYDCISSARAAASAAKALEYAQGWYQSVLELFRLSSASSAELSDAAALASANRAALISARYTFLVKLSSLRSLAGLESEGELAALIP